MSKTWNVVAAGMLAGAAGATAKNAVSYVDQILFDSAPPSSPNGPTVATTADTAAGLASGHEIGGTRATALGALGGLGIGVGIGAVAGAVRGQNATPNPIAAASVTGVAAMALGDGLAAAGGAKKVRSASNLGRDLVAHLAYGAVTGWALHRMLDPFTPTVSRFNPFD